MSASPASLLSAVILDWAGTTIDFGSRAPVAVFREVFRECGVGISEAEARGPMGLAKREHIRALLKNSDIARRWQAEHGFAPTDSDVDRLYERFLPLQRKLLAQHVDVISGVPRAISTCRDWGLKIGSTTGYTRELMDVVVPLAAEAGYTPDVCICSDEVSAGRPKPWMIFRAAESLDAYPPSRIVKVDDTPVGIEAARRAGVWAIGVVETGNQFGLSESELSQLDEHERQVRFAQVTAQFLAAGAHRVIPSVADLPETLVALAEDIEQGTHADATVRAAGLCVSQDA